MDNVFLFWIVLLFIIYLVWALVHYVKLFGFLSLYEWCNPNMATQYFLDIIEYWIVLLLENTRDRCSFPVQ